MQLQQQQMEMKQREMEMRHAEKMAELQIKTQQLQASVSADQQKIDLNRQEAIMDDDFKRDKLEVDALTGHYRDVAKVVTSTPPISYQQVTSG